MRGASAGALLLALLTVLLGGPAGADDEPTSVGWTDVLPPVLTPGVESAASICAAGDTRCTQLLVTRMAARLNPLAARCDHDAVFALYYLRTTEELLRAVSEPGFFEDPAFLNHWGSVFADAYFRAYDDWHGGAREAVPPAWRIAFEAADERAVSGTGNVLLGMSAHVNRDLPFVLASIGLRAPEGSSRKPDHDRVNVFLRRVVEPAREEGARRFDPTMDRLAVESTTLLDTTTFQLLVAWREEAWRKAELLVTTPPLLRPLVAEEIEQDAAATAAALRQQSAYPPLGDGAAARDEHCADSWRG